MQKGLESQGTKVKIYQIPDNFGTDILPVVARPWKNVPNISVDKLKNADGILWGMPIRFGSMPVQVKAFLDDTSRLLASRALAGKFTGFFFSSSSPHDGQETTAFAALANFYRHGMLYIPLGFTFTRTSDQLEEANGFVYGAEIINDKNSACKPTNEELDIARKQGINFAKVVKAYRYGEQWEEQNSSKELNTDVPNSSIHGSLKKDTEETLQALERLSPVGLSAMLYGSYNMATVLRADQNGA